MKLNRLLTEKCHVISMDVFYWTISLRSIADFLLLHLISELEVPIIRSYARSPCKYFRNSAMGAKFFSK